MEIQTELSVRALSRKGLLMITADEQGRISVNLSGNISPAELVFAMELMKKLALERSLGGDSIARRLDAVLDPTIGR